MKKLLIGFLALLLLAGAACGYWFGYQWYLERSWQRAAEEIEEAYPYLDVVSVMCFTGKELTISVDPLNRKATAKQESYPPYVLIAFEFVGDSIPTDEETIVLFNDLRQIAQRIAGHNTKLIVVSVSSAGTYYVGNVFAELHTGLEIKNLAQVPLTPLWWARFPAEFVLFPGRDGG